MTVAGHWFPEIVPVKMPVVVEYTRLRDTEFLELSLQTAGTAQVVLEDCYCSPTERVSWPD